MGIDSPSMQLLVDARCRGAEFATSCTLGRQNLYIRPRELERLFQRRGQATPSTEDLSKYVWGGYSDELLRDLLDVEKLDSLDFSDYEGASLVHNLNQPIPEELWRKYDAVVDAGTLEHVFNFPLAISNCMKMVKVGGRFFTITPANNFCGHGFYQFSFDLFFRIFDGANGFRLNRLLALAVQFSENAEVSRRRRVYEVTDPAKLRTRLGLAGGRPVLMLIEAEKVEDREPFSTYPTQSDYAANAAGHDGSDQLDEPPSSVVIASLKKLYHSLPPLVRAHVSARYQHWFRHTFRNRRAFRRLRGW